MGTAAPFTLTFRQEPGWAKGDRERETLWEKRGWKGENRTLGRRGRDVGGVEGLLRTYAQMQRLDPERGELVVGAFNVRTLAFKGANGRGHAEVILKTCEDAGCDVIGLQEVRRDGQSAFTAAGYVVFCSDGGKHEKKGNHGVGSAVREYRGRDG